MNENDSAFLQWLIGGVVAFFASWNLFTERRVEKLKDIAHERCVDKDSCKEDRERLDKVVDELKTIIKEGFQGVHRRIDKMK